MCNLSWPLYKLILEIKISIYDNLIVVYGVMTIMYQPLETLILDKVKRHWTRSQGRIGEIYKKNKTFNRLWMETGVTFPLLFTPPFYHVANVPH